MEQQSQHHLLPHIQLAQVVNVQHNQLPTPVLTDTQHPEQHLHLLPHALLDQLQQGPAAQNDDVRFNT